MRGARTLDLGRVLDGFGQAARIVAAPRVAAGAADQAAEGVGGGRTVERERRAALCTLGELWRQRVRLLDIGRPFEMIARAVRQLAMIDENSGAAVLRHQ